MRTHVLLGVALILAGVGSGAQDKPAAPAEKRAVDKDGKVTVEQKTPFGTARYEEKPTEQRVVGKDGKVTVEKETPFGTARYEEKPGGAGAEPPANIQAYEEGDTVRFESRTPFGVSKWTKQKSELNEDEQAALERQRKKSAGK